MRLQSCTLPARTLRLALSLLILLLALPGTATANDVIAEIDNLGDTLVFYPEVEFKELILTVIGPCSYEYRQVVEEGGTPFFRLTPETIDGKYTYSLVLIPEVDPDVIEILLKARKLGDNSEVNQLCRDGKMPGDPATQSHGFLIDKGEIVFDPYKTDAKADGGRIDEDFFAGFEAAGAEIPLKDFVINDDLIVDGSACIGFDCVNGESFGFDTIRVKENNLRIKFDDTSVAASFPRNDWQLTANDSANGGASKFSIDDISGNRTPFTVEANARSHSLYVDDGGRIGNRTSTPSTEIHTIDGDTPTLRLQQDGSSGFAPQTWDVAGNETNFFIRDVTNGSTLPFRIRPGAPTSSIFIDVDGDVGIGTSSPDASLNVKRSDGTAQMRIEETSGTTVDRTLQRLVNNGGVSFVLEDTSANTWEILGKAGLNFSRAGSGAVEMAMDLNGNVTITGSINTTDCSPCVSDYVFEPDYELMPLEDLAAFVQKEKHLPNVPSQGDVDRAGKLNMTEMQMKMLEKIEELALYTIEQQSSIKAHEETVKLLQERLAELEKD